MNELNTANIVKEVYSIDTRNYILWESMFNYFNLTAIQMSNEFNILYASMIKELNQKGLKYADFKNLLIPNRNKSDFCFVFDSLKTKNTSCYGYEIINDMLPSILELEKVSVFIGDIICDYSDGIEKIKKELQEGIPEVSFSNMKYTNQYFVIYLNNLSKNQANKIKTNLSNCKSYIGAINMSTGSFLKSALANTIINPFIKIEKKIIIPIVDNDERNSVNYLPCSFSKEYQIIPISEDIYQTFLHYKIPRFYIEGDILDQKFSLSFVTKDFVDLSDFSVEIEDKKYEKYLLTEKEGTLSYSGLTKLSKTNLIKLIQYAINTNEVYNIRLLSNGVLLFTTQINLNLDKPAKYILGFEINKIEKKLRLVTMY